MISHLILVSFDPVCSLSSLVTDVWYVFFVIQIYVKKNTNILKEFSGVIQNIIHKLYSNYIILIYMC